MPNRGALQIHLFAVAERVSALGTPGTGRVEVVVVTCLQNLAADVPLTISALDTERLLIILLAVGLAVFAHVLSTQNRPADQATKNKQKIQINKQLQNVSLACLTGSTKCAIVYPTLLELVLMMFETEIIDT